MSAWKRAAARVIKHRAPNGALRRFLPIATLESPFSFSHKAPSAKQCIKTASSPRSCRTDPCHKAPSAKRCIKTGEPGRGECRVVSFVIKHRAPNGALRHQRLSTHNCIRGCHKAPSANGALRLERGELAVERLGCVIKHRAPNGALRLSIRNARSECRRGRHKAPSAKRCIKTCRLPESCLPR